MSPVAVTTALVTEEQAAKALTPRTRLVVERAVGEATFEAVSGPVTGYRREVELRPSGDGLVEVRQTVEYRLAVPYWGWLFARPYRRLVGAIGEVERTPWWAPPEVMDAQAAGSLACLAALSAVLTYPGFLLTQTLTFAADEFGAGTRAQGATLAAMRADVVLAVGLVTLGDRHGRKRVAMAAGSAGCVLAGLGSLMPNIVAFGATQILSRGCIAAAGILITIMAAEEMPAGSRAYALSLLSAAAALGAAAVLALLPLADLDERAWRLLFAAAVLCLPFVRRVGRRLPETRRYQRPHADAGLTGHGRRFWLLAVSGFLLALFVTPAAQFQNEFLRDERGFSAARLTLFTVGTGIWGGIGLVAGGRLADLRGRRVVASVAVVGGVGATVLMFLSSGWPLWAWSITGSILGAAVVPALTVYGPELFPTAVRGRANGVINGFSRAGSVVGLLATGFLAARFDGLGSALVVLSIGPLLLAILILVAYPETARRELEELNPEDLSPVPSPP